jgi:predicted RNase H-like nuclease
MPDSILVGVDGCRDGWLFIVEAGASLRSGCAATAADLLEGLPENATIAIDVPIGLPDAGHREADRAARLLLGHPRGSSVFSAPVRACLDARSYEEACRLHFEADGRKLSRQAFGILPKIREVDRLLDERPGLQSRLREVHPEVSFALWNGGRPMSHRKSTALGKEERETPIESEWPGALSHMRTLLKGVRYSRDDLLDAFAALWTARRIASGEARSLPAVPATDAMGLRMEILA